MFILKCVLCYINMYFLDITIPKNNTNIWYFIYIDFEIFRAILAHIFLIS